MMLPQETCVDGLRDAYVGYICTPIYQFVFILYALFKLHLQVFFANMAKCSIRVFDCINLSGTKKFKVSFSRARTHLGIQLYYQVII